MPVLSDNVLDNGLSYLTTHGARVDICSAEPTNYTEATSTLTLGNKLSPTIGSPVNGDTNGRKVVLSAITDGNVTATGTASHYAIAKTSATTELLAATALAASQAVTNLNTWALTEADITIPDAV